MPAPLPLQMPACDPSCTITTQPTPLVNATAPLPIVRYQGPHTHMPPANLQPARRHPLRRCCIHILDTPRCNRLSFTILCSIVNNPPTPEGSWASQAPEAAVQCKLGGAASTAVHRKGAGCSWQGEQPLNTATGSSNSIQSSPGAGQPPRSGGQASACQRRAGAGAGHCYSLHRSTVCRA